MAYGDTVDPKNRIIALILVAAITLFIGYGLISGLAFDAAKKAYEKLTTVQIEEPPPPPPPETPPPPKEPKPEVAPPVVIPKSPIQRPTENKVEAVDTPPAIAPVTTTVAPPTPTPPAPPPPPPPPPPAPKQAAKPATPRGAPQNWVTTDDYPAGALREEKQGVTGVSVSVGPDGRAASCSVTSSSGSSELDSKACSLVKSRGRWNPAEDTNGTKIAGSWRGSFRWQLPNE